MVSYKIFLGCGLLQYKTSLRNSFYEWYLEISFVHKHFLFLIAQSFWFFCAEHDMITGVLCAKNPNDLKNEMDVIGEWDFARFEFNSWGPVY